MLKNKGKDSKNEETDTFNNYCRSLIIWKRSSKK